MMSYVRPALFVTSAFVLSYISPVSMAPVLANPIPLCVSDASDPDGDGWGFERGQSCRVQALCIDTDGDGWGWDGANSCLMSEFYSKFYVTAPCVDSDGDGWGWDGYRSCRIAEYELAKAAEPTIAESGCLDFDGDGWGWDGVQSCIVEAQSEPKIEPSPATELSQCSKVNSGDYPMTDLVTDVVLTAGQSNAAGNKTVYDPSHPLDRRSPRILAWTQKNQWEIADPQTQVWNAGRFPKSPGSNGFNHPAFQIARSIVQQDDCRVVAIIASSASGMAISHWLNDVDDHFTTITNRVSSALAQLPNKSAVDMIWWMQGESDNHPDHQGYFAQLRRLVDLFRAQPWFDASRYFLANETGWFDNANRGIRLLATDSDNNTNYSANPVSLYPNETLHITSEDELVHFNETALRIIGDLVRDEYLYDYRARISE